MTAVAALQIDDAVSSNTIPAFPQNRFVPWSNLDWVTRDYADYLSYTEESWNYLLTASLEQMPYTEVEQSLGLKNLQFGTGKSAAGLQHIAVDEETWDCWINHYVGNTWEDLHDVHDVSWAFEALGWSESNWQSDNQSDWPATELKPYDQLTEEETKAADRICCPAEVWDGIALTEWEYNDDGVSAAQLRLEGKDIPTDTPTKHPFTNPTDSPMTSPVNNPINFVEADLEDTEAPTEYVRKTDSPSRVPTNIPSTPPSFVPSYAPSEGPSRSFNPSVAPSDSPSKSVNPSSSPSAAPSAAPSDGPSIAPTVSPSSEPSSEPTAFGCRANFTLVLLTDKYPVETTWTLTLMSSNSVIGEGSGYKNDFETHEENVCLRYDSCYMFEIRDKWNDGICCSNGQGNYAGFLQYEGTTTDLLPIPGVSGGAFESSVRHKFCLDENGDLVEGLGNAIGVRFNGEE